MEYFARKSTNKPLKNMAKIDECLFLQKYTHKNRKDDRGCKTRIHCTCTKRIEYFADTINKNMIIEYSAHTVGL